jgi:hypothetical protein
VEQEHGKHGCGLPAGDRDLSVLAMDLEGPEDPKLHRRSARRYGIGVAVPRCATDAESAGDCAAGAPVVAGELLTPAEVEVLRLVAARPSLTVRETADALHAWLQAVSHVNPLTYEVDALRGLLVYTPAHLALDFAVLVASAATGIVVAAQLIERLARG